MHHPIRLIRLTVLSVLLANFPTPKASAIPLPSPPITSSPRFLTQSPTSDRKAEADRLRQQGVEQLQSGQLRDAITSLKSALQIYREIDDAIGEISSLGNLGFAYLQAEDYLSARDYMEQVVALYREQLGDRHPSVARSLANLGSLYQAQRLYAEAEPLFQESLSIYLETLGSDHPEVARTLTNLGFLYQNQGRYAEAEPLFQESLSIYREQLGDRHPEVARTLTNLGSLYQNQGRYAEAEPLFQESLSIYREQLGDRHPEVARTLTNLGSLYQAQGRYAEAEPLFQESLSIYRTGLGPDNLEIAASLNNLGSLYVAQGRFGDYQRAIDYYEQSLEIALEIGDRRFEGIALGDLGNAYYSLGQYRESIEYHEQARTIAREIGDFQGEASATSSLGNVYAFLGEYETAIHYHEIYLSLVRNLGDKRGEANGLNNIGEVYRLLGDFDEAIELYQQSLKIATDVDYYQGFSNTLGNISLIYSEQGDYEMAIQYAEESLRIKRENGIILGIVNSLNNLGLFNVNLRNFDKALEWYQEGIEKVNEIRDLDAYASLLFNTGITYYLLDSHSEAMEFLGKSLSIFRAVENRASEGIVLATFGKFLSEQNQPELAIVFLKASVEVRESIRGDIRGLDTELQQSFTDTVADDYRLLADLLLEQGRIPEAQQVLDLLKLEELREFTDTTRTTWNGEELRYTDIEKPVITAHGSLIALGGAILTCEDTDCPELEDLYDQRDALTAQYNDQVEQFAEAIRANRSDDPIFQDPDQLSDEAKGLLSAYAADGQTPALIYPFVLEDKLWLVWAIEGRVIGSAEVPVSQGELSTTVQRFGELLNAPTRLDELQAQGQQLYDWIIKPLAAELETNGIDHLIFVNDRVTRYIPMAALYDGEQFLIERFQVSTVLAPGVTNTSDRLGPIDQSQVLGLGLSKPVSGFNPLPAVDMELDAIVRSDDSDTVGIYPGQVYLNDAFTFDALKTNVRHHRVLHLATHAAFVPGRADESFIVLGNGDRLTAGDIEDISPRLDHLHLVILSACETALGAATGDGTEITGISSYFLGANDSRAETVIASLWAVSDRSTSILMQRFYELLASGELTKAEALRQAQLSFLYNEDTETRLTAVRSTGAVPTPRPGFEVTSDVGDRHPYYWAPFILIGNAL